MTKLKYRECPYCKRIIAPSYSFYEHKRYCKVVKAYNNQINKTNHKTKA